MQSMPKIPADVTNPPAVTVILALLSATVRNRGPSMQWHRPQYRWQSADRLRSESAPRARRAGSRRLGWVKGCLVLAPQHEQARLNLSHPCLPLRIKGYVGPVGRRGTSRLRTLEAVHDLIETSCRLDPARVESLPLQASWMGSASLASITIQRVEPSRASAVAFPRGTGFHCVGRRPLRLDLKVMPARLHRAFVQQSSCAPIDRAGSISHNLRAQWLAGNHLPARADDRVLLGL